MVHLNNDTSGVDEMSHDHKGGYAFCTSILTTKKNADKWKGRFPLVGVRTSQMNDLRNFLFKARVAGFRVISVWGIAGVGKSALVRSLYYALMSGKDKESFAKYSWVDVSRPFNLRNFASSLLSEFHSDSPQQNENSNNPIQGCRKLLDNYPCLVVIDGLISMEEWDLIRHSLVSPSSKSMIIVITTDASIATHCANREEAMYNVKSLEGDEAIDLFKAEVRHLKESSALLKSNASELKELVLKCGGLPKVIVALADFLAPMSVNWMNSVLVLNSRFMTDLETKPEFDELRELFRWLHSYFRTCPDYLKPCILYLSIFPQGQSIRRRRLVRRWIAEGYARDSNNMSAEDNGEKFFSLLLDLSIIQQPPHSVTNADTRMVLCQVHSFFREYIISRQEDEDLVFKLKGRCTLTTQRTGRHLVIKESWDRDMIVFSSIDFSRLRSLTVFGEWRAFFISKTMKVLRVLDLENASGVTYEYLEQMVKQFPRLKFLSLRGIKEICHLPCSLGGMRQLETLDVRETSIATLPNSITKLMKLQYIRAGTSAVEERPLKAWDAMLSWLPGRHTAGPVYGVELPTGVEKLTALHTLGVVDVGLSGGKDILKELKKLTQLRKLGVTGLTVKNSKELCSAIKEHAHLESLSVWLTKGKQNCLDDIFPSANPRQQPQKKPLENLQSLKLYGLIKEVPTGFSDLPKLTKLNLHITIEANCHISDVLGEIKELCVLRLFIKPRQGVDSIRFHVFVNGIEKSTYLKVKIFEISCSSELNVSFGSETMPNLELLKVHYSSGSILKFDKLEDLSRSKLKEVQLIGSINDTLKDEVNNLLKEHPRQPSLKSFTKPCSS